MAFILLIISCNGSTPYASSETSAPVPEFLDGIKSKEVVLAENEPSDIDQDFYRYFAGGFSLLGFEGETSAKEISDIDVLGSNVTFSWTEKNGVYSYIGQGENIAIKLTYDTVNESVGIMQVSKGYAKPYYCFVVFNGTDISYDIKNKTLDGKYNVYLAGASNESDEYYFISLGEGFAHSDENATGILTTEIINFGPMDGDTGSKISFTTNPSANIETGNKLIAMMEKHSQKELNNGPMIDIKVLYAKNGSYYQYPGNTGDDTATPEEMADYIKKHVSDKWIIDSDDLPAPACASI